MSHFKSNLRDVEFNLFELFNRQDILGQGPFAEIDTETAQSILVEVDRLSREDLAAVLRRGRPQPAGLRPGHQDRHHEPRVRQELPGLDGLRVVAPAAARGARRPAVAQLARVVDRRVRPRRQPRHLDVRCRPRLRSRRVRERQRARSGKIAQHMVDNQWGCTMVLDRARRRFRRRRRPRQGHAERGRLLEHRGRQALHHLGRARHEREHHAPRAGPPGRHRGRRRTRHQGPEPVPRSQDPLRSRDRRADRRAQRRLRHQRREEDGHQDLHDVRGHLRRRRTGHRLAARRGARRHQPDVPRHRERPHDGGRQGHRHAVDRLPQRARLRQGARAGCRPDAGVGQDRAARHDHAPPRRPSLADDAEVVRRGPAFADALRRHLAGRGHDQGGRR